MQSIGLNFYVKIHVVKISMNFKAVMDTKQLDK